MRRVIVLFLILISIVGGSVAYVYWPSIQRRIRKITVNKEQESKDLQKTKELLNQSKPEEALAIIQQYNEEVDPRTEIGKEWLQLLIRASEATLNLPQLLVLHEYFPKLSTAMKKLLY